MLSFNPVKPEVVYHAPVFEPTVDELALLKKLELGQAISLSEALHDHVSKRLFEWGMVVRREGGDLGITALGMRTIQRVE
ncbi:MAG: hypothetical protein RSD57_13385 [Comamonas sp.]|jgi:hypothetical protein